MIAKSALGKAGFCRERLFCGYYGGGIILRLGIGVGEKAKKVGRSPDFQRGLQQTGLRFVEAQALRDRAAAAQQVENLRFGYR
ncbi:MAG: hypothetical protein ACTS1Z_09115 [Parasphingopyxis sp.]